MSGSIVVSDIGKAYKKYTSKWSRLLEWLTPWNYSTHSLVWVLRGLNFSAMPGQAIGIIGNNGAGKSTLLKLIVGTIQPSEGSIRISGRVAAILELGMGFLPEFTGRQNIYMAGQLLGLGTAQITRLMPEIEEFAEIGHFIDEPLRIYSSGMQMRLAFSIATAVRPDVLIIDEALSVGDAYFQHKSFNRIRDFQKSGTTLLIVSHDKEAIQALCSHAIFLHDGNIAMQGSPQEVMDYYNAVRSKTPMKLNIAEDSSGAIIARQHSSGTGEAKTLNVQLLDENLQPIEIVRVGQEVILEISVQIFQKIDRLVLGYGIKDRLGQVIYGTNTHLKNAAIDNPPIDGIFRYRFSFIASLGVGSYSIQTALTSSEDYLISNYEWRELACLFTVVSSGVLDFAGCAWIDPAIEVTHI